MRYNTVIIGGGLAGLTCGIRLAENGKRCAIISQGQSALHFSSGSFDLLNTMPDGTVAHNPLEAIRRFAEEVPQHPYSKIGYDSCVRYAREIPGLFSRAGLNTVGDCESNHYRITPMGIRKPTWLTLQGYLTTASEKGFGWQDVAIFNIEGFLDFYPEFIAESLRGEGVHCTCYDINVPDLTPIRKNPSEMRSTNIARIFDKQENIRLLAEAIKEKSDKCNNVILPAVMGINRTDTLDNLRALCNKNIFLVPTLPPSIPGIQAQQQMKKYFQKLGGDYFLGDIATGIEISADKVMTYTGNHGKIPFISENAVIATGSFFSKGLIATPDRIYEPVMGLDTDYVEGRENWYNLDFFSRQGYMEFGLHTTGKLTAVRNGNEIPEIFVIGAGLSGFNPIRQGCGAGVSAISAMYVADQLLSK